MRRRQVLHIGERTQELVLHLRLLRLRRRERIGISLRVARDLVVFGCRIGIGLSAEARSRLTGSGVVRGRSRFGTGRSRGCMRLTRMVLFGLVIGLCHGSLCWGCGRKRGGKSITFA